MKTKISLLLFLLLPMFLFSQNKSEYRKFNRYHFKHVEWNGQQYDNNIRGIRMLLENVETVDPVLHLVLENDYKKYKNRKRNGGIIAATGILVGSVFIMVAGLEGLAHGGDESPELKKKRVNSLAVGGFFSYTLGIGFGVGMQPKSRKFIYNFTQRINDNTNLHKATYVLSPAINLSNNPSIGLSFSLVF